jgi:YnbE-like lipoprotein
MTGTIPARRRASLRVAPPVAPRVAMGCLILLIAGCSPTVKLEAPDKPIEINLNIKIEQEVRIKVERDLEKVFAEDPDLFGTAGGGTRK